MAFLEDLKGFYGTGEKNRAGQSLEEFLDRYDPRKYDCPSCTTDIVAVQFLPTRQRGRHIGKSYS